MVYHYNNTPIYYEVYGEGPVWVFLHGFLESSEMWSQFITDFSGERTIVTIDLPGHGSSGCIAKVHTMELMADVVGEVLNFLKITHVTLIGHSMGGYVALAYAESYSERIEKIILLNSTPEEDTEERKASRSRVLRIIETNREAFISMAITNLFPPESHEKYKEVITQLKQRAMTFPPEGISAAIKGMKDREDRTNLLKNPNFRCFLFCGVADGIVPITSMKAMAEQLAVALFEIAGGHMSWIENYDTVKSLLHLIDKK